jgi:hypothetical protein
MADITMCENEDCDLNKLCYRFKAKPDKYRQAYGYFQPVYNSETEKVECEYFYPITTKEESGE